MNPDTVSLVTRPYLEIVDDLLTAIIGGVVNEPQLFDVKSERYPLTRPALAIRSVTGTPSASASRSSRRSTTPIRPPTTPSAWLPGGRHPDDNTTFFVDYIVPNSASPISDINVGSVTRTLAEAIGREIATVYEQVNAAHRAGFVDTATGTALDLVVSILDVHRKTKDFAQGLVTFFRDPSSSGAINIPVGTLLLAATPERPEFETTETRTLQAGTARIDVPVRATEAFKGAVGEAPPGAISELVVLLDGIARVSNLDQLVLGDADESDDELRDRARAALRSVSKGTEAALRRAVQEERATLLELWDPNAPLERRTEPGHVALLVEAEPERFPSLVPALHDVRAAGVELAVVARYVYLKLRVTAKMAPNLPAAGQDKLRREVIDALQGYVDGLASGAPAEGAAMLALLGKVDGLSEPKILDAIPSRSDVSRPALESLVDDLAGALTPPPADDAALRAALAGVLQEAAVSAPTAARAFDRGLVLGPSGQRAAPSDIEAGTFSVTLPDDGQTWWLVLDMAPEDVDARA